MIEKVETLWVKKHTSKKEYEEYYQLHPSYSYLGADPERGGVNLGFLVANPMIDGVLKYRDGFLPYDCEALTEEELYTLADTRKSANSYPLPNLDKL